MSDGGDSIISRNSSSGHTNNNDSEMRAAAAEGAVAVAADSANTRENSEEKLCQICRLDLVGNDDGSDDTLEAFACGHVFHKECANKWVEHQQCPRDQCRCPVCRQSAVSLRARERDVGIQPAGSMLCALATKLGYSRPVICNLFEKAS